MRTAIIGTGALGTLFAGLLSTVTDVAMIGSWTQQLQVVSQRGLIVRHIDDTESTRTFFTTSRAEDAYPAEVALVLVKSWQTSAAAIRSQMVLAPTGLAITLQNGLGNLETLAAHLGSARVAQGVTSEGATLLEPGLVRHAGQGHTYLSASDATRPQIENVAELFKQAGLDTTVVVDAKSLQWGKLAINAGINPLTALLQVPNGWLLQYDVTLDIMSSAADEVALVAEELGIKLPFGDAASQAKTVAAATAANRSSMAQDIARGMPTEIEQITGAVVRYGRKTGVPTPVNAALLLLVRAQIAQNDWRDAVSELAQGIRPRFRDLATLEM